MKRDYRCYPVRIDQDGGVFTLDGVQIGGPEMARAIKDGFAAATPEAFGGGDEESGRDLRIRKKHRGRAG